MKYGQVRNAKFLGVLRTSFMITSLQGLIKPLKMSSRKTKGFIALAITGFLLGNILLLRGEVSDIEFYEQTVCLFFLGSLTFFDLQDKTVPVGWVVFGGVCGMALLFLMQRQHMVQEVIGTLIIIGSLFLISKATREAIGIGDALVLGLISLFLGWKLAVAIFVLALFLAGVCGVSLMIMRKAHKKSTLPFIPFLLVGTLWLLWA